MECIKEQCNGSGIIWLASGKGVPCPCRRFNKASEHYKNSNSPKEYKVFIDDLSNNPLVQNITKKEVLQKKYTEGELTEERFKELRKTEFTHLKNMLKQFDDGKNNKPVKRFIQNNYKLYFYGDTGTSKTQSAISLGYEAGKRNCRFMYVSLHDIHRLFRYNFNSEVEKEKVSETIKKIEESDILILDDLGKEVDGLNLSYDSDVKLLKQIHTFLDGVLRKRNRLVIITTNTKPEEIKETYKKLDPRLYSMLFDGNILTYYFRDKIRQKKQDDILLDLF